MMINEEQIISMKNMSAILLAGGKSSRMKEEKCMLSVAGIPLIKKIASQLDTYFDEIIISTNTLTREQLSFLPYRTAVDKQPHQGPMMGVLGGLELSNHPVNFVIACDIPEIDFNFVSQMAAYTRQYEIVVPVSGQNLYEPLFAFYNQSLIPRIKNLLENDIRKIIRLFDLAKTIYIPFQNDGWYHNLNTKDDYHRFLKKNNTKPTA
jgi:molybdopterin-guanine dinucleotide biosynthesis protein A